MKSERKLVFLVVVGFPTLFFTSTVTAVTLSHTKEICVIYSGTGAEGNCTDWHQDLYVESLKYDCLLTKQINQGAGGLQTRFHRNDESNVMSENSNRQTDANSSYAPTPLDQWCLSNDGEYCDEDDEPYSGQNYSWPPKDCVYPYDP